MYPQHPHTCPPSGHHQPLFRVRLVKHTGLIMMWHQQTYTVTGTYAQCEAAIRAAQQYNLIAGWWSFLSVLLMNWIALGANQAARKQLQHAATQYGAPRPTHPTA